MNGKRQQDIIVVAVVDQFPARLHPFGTRPLDFPGAEAWRKLPFERWWLAGISGVDPVNVPAMFQYEMHTELQIGAGFNRWLPSQQFDASVLSEPLGHAYYGTSKHDKQAGSPTNMRGECHNSILLRKLWRRGLERSDKKRSAGF